MKRSSGTRRKRFILTVAAFLATAGSLEATYRTIKALRCGIFQRHANEQPFDLYAVGESIAAGYPYENKMSLADMVSLEFKGSIGGRNVRAICVARPGESVYPQSIAFEKALRCRNPSAPGAVLIYSGNNDAWGPRYETVEYIREGILAKSEILKGILFYLDKLSIRFGVRPLHSYECHLREIIETSLKNGLVPILSTVVTNRADMDPGIPADCGIPPGQVRAWVDNGRMLESKHEYRQAIRFYDEQERAHPQIGSFWEYRIGKCFQKLGQYARADRYFKEILDWPHFDNFGRATSRQNALIRRLAAEYSIPLVDAVALFEENSPHGLPGNELFSDGHHPNLRGYILLANAYARAVSQKTNSPLRQTLSSPGGVSRELNFTSFDRRRALLSTGRWLFSVSVMHYDPYERLEKARRCFKQVLEIFPNDVSAWLGLGLVEAARRDDFLSKRENIEFLDRHHLFYGADYEISDGNLPEILDKLRSNAVGADILKHIRKTRVPHG